MNGTKFKISMVIVTLLLCMTGCVSQNKKDEQNTNVYPKFVSKCITKDQEDDWFYFFCIQYPKKDGSLKKANGNYNKDTAFSYVFDGFNLKYKTIDGYYIPIFDENGEEVGDIEPAVPSLSVSSTIRNEIKEINDFFTKEDFNRIITEDDLKELKVKSIDKKLLIELFNKAYSKDPIELGKWVDLPQVEILKSEKIDDFQFNIGYYVEYGNLQKINIDLLYENGSYLSDLVKEKKATTKEINQYNELQNIEKYILEEQSFDLSNYKKSNIEHFSELKKILSSIS